MAQPSTPLTPSLRSPIDAIATWESPWSRDNSPPWGMHDKDPVPCNRLHGPVHPRGGVAGVIHHRGSLRAQWGTCTEAT